MRPQGAVDTARALAPAPRGTHDRVVALRAFADSLAADGTTPAPVRAAAYCLVRGLGG